MCWHKWSKWEIMREGFYKNSRGAIVGLFSHQCKQCEKCGLIKYKITEKL